MKLYINHSNSETVKEIVEKMINGVSRSIMAEKPDSDEELVAEIVKVVQQAISETMNTLLFGSTSTIIEFDIENAVGQVFENVAKMVKWEKENQE